MRAAAGLLVIAAALSLMACRNNDGEQQAPVDHSDQAAKATAAPSSAEQSDNQITAATTGGITSIYTSTGQESCTTIEENTDEGGWVVQRCQGIGGVPVFVKEGDLRQDIDAGVQSSFETQPMFNTVGTKVEWRLADNRKPFAIIYRLNGDSGDPEIPKQSWLIVESIGTATKPGCRVAVIDAGQSDANEKARDAADQLASAPPVCFSAG